MSASRRYAARVLTLLALLGFAAFFLVPIAWMIAEPIRSQGSLGAVGVWRQAFDRAIRLQGGILLTWMENSAIYCACGSALALALSIPAGYGLALTRFVGRRTLLVVTLVVMIMPLGALVLPLLLEAQAVGLLDTVWSIVLPFGLFPFGTYLAYLFFSSAIPRNLLAAARIDGAGEWQVFRHVALPLARPIVALVGYFAVVTDWNNFFLPFVMTSYDWGATHYPLQVGLQQLVEAGITDTPGEAAMAALLATAPLLVVFVLAQRMLVRSVLAGASRA